MGDVVLFSQRAKPAAPRAADAGTGEARSATIMFFTGVRYQRASEAAPAPTNGGRPSSEGGVGGKRKRKRG